jgi:hypothetical protein
METGVPNKNFIRQYYDGYSLWGREEIQAFIGTEAHLQQKKTFFKRRPGNSHLQKRSVSAE